MASWWKPNGRSEVDKWIFLIGNSMSPSMKSGGWHRIEEIKNCGPSNVKVGDVVVYWSKGFNKEGKPAWWHMGRVCHRIVDKDASYAYIKGDNRTYTEKVEYKEIKGKMIL